jgi:hypothetical protein
MYLYQFKNIETNTQSEMTLHMDLLEAIQFTIKHSQKEPVINQKLLTKEMREVYIPRSVN